MAVGCPSSIQNFKICILTRLLHYPVGTSHSWRILYLHILCYMPPSYPHITINFSWPENHIIFTVVKNWQNNSHYTFQYVLFCFKKLMWTNICFIYTINTKDLSWKTNGNKNHENNICKRWLVNFTTVEMRKSYNAYHPPSTLIEYFILTRQQNIFITNSYLQFHWLIKKYSAQNWNILLIIIIM